MAANIQAGPEANNVPGLLTGIVHDIQDLAKQELELLKHHVEGALTTIKEASGFLAVALFCLLAAGVLLCIALAEALRQYTTIPAWGCYLIVAGVVAVPGVALAVLGWQKLWKISELPEQSVAALKENLEWTKKPKS
jgi:hypothetical protein